VKQGDKGLKKVEVVTLESVDAGGLSRRAGNDIRGPSTGG
jgi:hypothetical protein